MGLLLLFGGTVSGGTTPAPSSPAYPTATVEIDFTTNLSTGLAYYEQVQVSGPFAYYRLQEAAGTSAADGSGNSVAGTIAGTVTLNQTSSKPVSGETASRYVILGSGGRVTFTGQLPAANCLSMEAWVYRSTLDGSAATEYEWFDNPGTAASKSILQANVRGNGSVKAYMGNASLTTTSTPISAGTWYHVVVTMDGPNKTGVIYVNGVAQTTTLAYTAAPSLTVTLSNLDLNWRFGSSGSVLVTQLAEPAFYMKVLSATEVADHYAAAATVPFAGYTWTDVTPYVLFREGINRTFGRESDTDDVAPMELTYLLRNFYKTGDSLASTGRWFEPGNTQSPYYPNVEPGRPTRVRLTQAGTVYDWAFGFIEDFPQDWDESVTLGYVPIRASCFLARMNNEDIGSRAFFQQATGSRLAVLLNVVGQPQSMRTLDTGAYTLMGLTDDQSTPGDHARKAARSDRGLFFFDPAGYAIFQDGNYRTTNARSITSRGTLGAVTAGTAVIPYSSPDFHSPLEQVSNVINLTRPGGVTNTAADQPSRKKYGTRTYSADLLLSDDSAMATRAAALLADLKSPQLRIRAVTFNPARGNGYWTHALGVRLSDNYVWQFVPKQGSSRSLSAFVEGVSDTYADKVYTSTWFLST